MHLRDTMDAVKHTHCAIPLRVYLKKKLINIEDISDILNGALVELHFELHHFEIAAKNLHSFNANIEQIMVLQPGESCPATVYKHHAAEDGLVRMNPTLAALQDEAESGEFQLGLQLFPFINCLQGFIRFTIYVYFTLTL